MKRSHPLVEIACLGMTLFGATACGGPQQPQPNALPPLRPPALQPFVQTLKDLGATVPQPTAAAQKELADLGEIALQLVEADARTAARAERALLEHPFASVVLEPALQHAEVATRRRAAWLCGQSGQAVLQLPLLLRLKYELDPEAVLWVADALQRLGNDSGLPYLDVAMGQAATAQQAGTLAIGIGKERNLPLAEAPTYEQLQSALRGLAAQWRATGTSSRPGCKPPTAAEVEPRFAVHLVTTEGTLLRPVDDAKFVISRCGVLAVPLLVRTLGATENYLRNTSLGLLADLGPCARSAGPAVLPLLGDVYTNFIAVRTLGEIGWTEALPHLRPLLTHDDTELRSAAVQALGLLGDTASAPQLRERLDDAKEAIDVRVGAAFGLLCLGADAAAEAFLREREQKGDYHAPTLARLRERLRALGR